MRKPRKPWPERFWEKVDKTPGHGPEGTCWKWIGGTDSAGYGQLRNPEGRLTMATHIVWELTHQYKPHFMCHQCDNPPCVNPSHLFEGDPQINAADMVIKGRSAKGDYSSARLYRERLPRGENHFKARLTDADVKEIRAIYQPAPQGARNALVSQRILAKRYGVAKNTIQAIIEGKTWRHLQ